MITERTLKRWRKEAFEWEKSISNFKDLRSCIIELNQRILRMTQELLDAHLLRKK